MASPMNTGAEFSSIGASAPLPPPRRLNRPAWTVPVQAGRTISGSAPPPPASRLFRSFARKAANQGGSSTFLSPALCGTFFWFAIVADLFAGRSLIHQIAISLSL